MIAIYAVRVNVAAKGLKKLRLLKIAYPLVPEPEIYYFCSL